MFLRLAAIAGFAAGLAACSNTGASVSPGAVTGNVSVTLPQPAAGTKVGTAVNWFCQTDNILHPIADGVLSALGVPAGNLVNDDVVHPLIAAYCAAHVAGSTATAVVTGTATATVVAAPMPAPAPAPAPAAPAK